MMHVSRLLIFLAVQTQACLGFAIGNDSVQIDGPRGNRESTTAPPTGTRKPRPFTFEDWWRAEGGRIRNGRARESERRTFTTAGLSGIAARATEDVRRALARSVRSHAATILRSLIADPVPDVRNAAIIALGRLSLADDLPMLLGLLVDDRESVRESACLAVGLLGRKEGLAPLIEIAHERSTFAPTPLRTHSIRMRATAVLAIGWIGRHVEQGETSAVDLLVSLCSNPNEDPEIAFLAATVLGEMQARRAVDPLKAILRNEKFDGRVRAAAAIGLAQLGEWSVVPDLLLFLDGRDNTMARGAVIALSRAPIHRGRSVVQAMRRTIEQATDPEQRFLAVLALGAIGGFDERRELVGWLSHRNQARAGAAALALAIRAARGTEEEKATIGAAIVAGLESRRVFVEEHFIVALGILGWNDAVPILRQRFSNSTGRHKSILLITALGLLGAEEAATDIREWMRQSGYGNDLSDAFRALSMCDRNAASFLLDLSRENRSPSMEIAALDGFADTLDPRALPIVAAMTAPEYLSVESRVAAVRALGRIADSTDLPFVDAVVAAYRLLGPAPTIDAIIHSIEPDR